MATTNDPTRSDWAPFRCEIAHERDHVRVIPHGELDIATAPTVKERIDGLRAAGTAHVVLDLRQLVFMDSTGLRVVLAQQAAATGEGWTFELIAGPPGVQRVMEISGFLPSLPFRAP